MAFQPLYDRVVVRRDEKVLITPGGIERVEQYTQLPIKGTVVSVGCGIVRDGVLQKPQVGPGDRIMFAHNAGVELEIDGEKVLMMLEANILGIIQKNAPAA